jgi:antitoxin (DNA-binding transcriptional repressor) of toxin-antitoxin stability system
MLDITIDEIQRDPIKYLRQVEAGEALVILWQTRRSLNSNPLPDRNLVGGRL